MSQNANSTSRSAITQHIDTGAESWAPGFVFVSSEGKEDSLNPSLPNDFESHTRNAFHHIICGLTEHGCTLDDVAKVTVWMKDMSLANDFNRVFLEHFSWRRPLKNLMQSDFVFGSQIVLEVIAYKKTSAEPTTPLLNLPTQEPLT